MFDVGFWELAIIGIVALLILGPERLPQAARTAGLWIGKARRMLGELKADFDREIREHAPADLESVKHDIESAGGAFQQAAQDVNEAMQVDKPNDKPAKTVKTGKKKTRGKKTVGKASGNKRGGNVVKKHRVKKRAVKKPIGNKRVIKKRTVKKPITNKRKR